MKKLTAILLIMTCLLCFAGCKSEKTEITAIGDYDAIWTLSERRASESSFLFPTAIIPTDVQLFKCEHINTMPIGTEWEVILKLQYNTETFKAEADKIQSLCKGSPIHGESDHFDTVSYASVWNWNSCFEYAILNEEENTITYVYLQLKDKDDISIDSKYLPKDYKLEMGTSEFSIYK